MNCKVTGNVPFMGIGYVINNELPGIEFFFFSLSAYRLKERVINKQARRSALS